MRPRINTRAFRATILAFAGAMLVLAGSGAARAADRWVAIGPEGGTVVGLAFDAAGPRTVYAAVDEAGVWRSDDGGATWAARGSGLTPGTIHALAVDPATAGSLWIGRSDGVWTSTDGGGAWMQVAAALGGLPADIRVLAFDATTRALWAAPLPQAGQAPLYRSDDGGGHWTGVDLGVPDLIVTALAFGGGDVFAGTTGRQGIFRGAGGGSPWQRVLDGESVADLAWGAGRLYAAVDGGLRLSVDRGATWELRIGLPPSTPGLPRDFLALGKIGLSPEDPNRLLVGYHLQPVTARSVDGIYRSTDGGATHSILTGGLPALQAQAFLFAPGPAGGLLAAPGSLGVWASADGVSGWRGSNRGLRAAPIGAVLADPKRPGLLYGAVGGQGLWRTLNGGATWQSVNGGGMVVVPLALDPTQPATIYAFGVTAGTSALYKSRNGGRSWSLLRGGTTAFALDPLHPRTLFAGAPGGGSNPISRSDDGGATWRDGTVSCTFPEHLVVAASGEVYVGGSSLCGFGGFSGGGTDRSDDGGKTFASKREGLPGIPSTFSLAVDPRRPATLFGGFGGLIIVDGELRGIQSLFRSRDRADHWEEVPSMAGVGAPVVDLAFPPNGPNAIWVATDGRGIWRSGDAGETFREIGSPGLPTRRVADLEFDRRSPAVLYAATPGGLFQLASD